ncbi:MAG: septum formation initiator family protein [Ignavibacteriales bacterium]|nr:septum formation initiator family protein [Ignavibacteriales bacterium]
MENLLKVARLAKPSIKSYLSSVEFYRKIQKRAPLKSLTRKLLRNKLRTFLLIAGTFLFSYALFGNHGVLTRLRLERQRTEMMEKVRQAEEETKKLQSQIKALEGDKKTIEKIAREKYGMVREGETIYRVKKD